MENVFSADSAEVADVKPELGVWCACAEYCQILLLECLQETGWSLSWRMNVASFEVQSSLLPAEHEAKKLS